MPLEIHVLPGGSAGPGRCPCCWDPIDRAEVVCPACRVGLHLECHALLRRCPTVGCAHAVRAFRGAPQPYLVEGRYEVLARIGPERYGLACHAVDRKLNEDVALVYLHAEVPRAADPLPVRRE